MENIPNIDNETMNKIKNLVDNGNLTKAISQISPEMIANFSKMMENNNSNSQNNINSNNYSNSSESNSTNENYNTYENNNNHYTKDNSSNSTPNFDLNNIDINTIMKLSSAFGSVNNKNDPRSNLLNSLKPYLRDTKKNKLDNYVNLLNMSKIAEVLKNTNNTNVNNKNENSKENNNA